MKPSRCRDCGSVNLAAQPASCARCGVSYDGAGAGNVFDGAATVKLAARDPIDAASLKANAWKKIKWGLIVALAGFAITGGAVALGVFQGYSNTDNTYLEMAKGFSLITILPLAIVLAGTVELVTGVSIFTIIEKWEQLPEWLGWLIGIAAFLLIVILMIVVAAIVLFTFF